MPRQMLPYTFSMGDKFVYACERAPQYCLAVGDSSYSLTRTQTPTLTHSRTEHNVPINIIYFTKEKKNEQEQ